MLFAIFQKSKHHFTNINSSGIRIRGRLGDFFKQIHPDQLSQAPSRIRQQNQRSLTNLNSYFDAINQEKTIDAKLLKFYIPEKSNAKSRKFFTFNLELPQLNNQNLDKSEKKTKLVDDIVQSKTGFSKKSVDKLSIESEIKLQTQNQRFNRLQQTLQPFNEKRRRGNVLEKQRIESQINSRYIQSQNEALKMKLRSNINFADTNSNKSMSWSRLAMEQSGIYKDYQDILQNLVDPKLIFFDENLQFAEIEQFKKKVLPGQLKRLGAKQTQAILRFSQEFTNVPCPLCLYVSKGYSFNEIPGFFSIPYNFQPYQLLTQFRKGVDTIINQRLQFEQYFEFYEELNTILLKENNFKIKTLDFKNNKDISEKILCLQRIQRLKSTNIKINISILEEDQYRIFCNQYNLNQKQTVHHFKNQIYIRLNFSDQQLQMMINSQNKAQ